jgi:hypothetical protein
LFCFRAGNSLQTRRVCRQMACTPQFHRFVLSYRDIGGNFALISSLRFIFELWEIARTWNGDVRIGKGRGCHTPSPNYHFHRPIEAFCTLRPFFLLYRPCGWLLAYSHTTQSALNSSIIMVGLFSTWNSQKSFYLTRQSFWSSQTIQAYVRENRYVRGGLISGWLYKGNNKLRDWKLYLLYIFPPELHTLTTSLF